MELATGLRVAEHTPGQRLHVARVLPSQLPQLNQALRAGRVSYGHVLLVVRATEPLTDQAARAVDATLARRIAADAAWRRMITDPITRRLLDRSPTTYRPGDQLAAYVRARDLMCDQPGCTKPADGCQLDHDNPFNPTDPDGGRTTAEELKLRCDPHHNGKTHLGWATGVRADGTRSPLGFDYDLEPNPYLDHGQRRPSHLTTVTTD
jgi:hypothetical protein